MAAGAFRRAGYDAYSMDGGLVAWEEQGLPLEPAGRTRRRPLMRAALLAAGAAHCRAAPAAAAPELVKLGDFASPVHVASPPNDPRVFVVEQAGLVKIVGGGTFLDISARHAERRRAAACSRWRSRPTTRRAERSTSS